MYSVETRLIRKMMKKKKASNEAEPKQAVNGMMKFKKEAGRERKEPL